MILSSQQNQHRWAGNLFVCVLGVVIFTAFIAYVLVPAMERESQWQAQRLCKNYDHCIGTGV